MNSTTESTTSVRVLGDAPAGRALDQVIADRRAWTRTSLQSSDWLVPLPAECIAELQQVVDTVRAQPLPVLMLSPDQFDLPECRKLMAEVRRVLTQGSGVALVDRLPLDRLGNAEAPALAWILGRCLAPLVAQKYNGTMIYDVKDTGAEYGYGVRASVTNAELFFHTDNCFAVAPPDYVSLLCIYPALSGGVSRFCSAYTVHNLMLQRHPRLLRRLYQPVYFDRQSEHHPAGAKVVMATPFSYAQGALKTRLNIALIRRGYALMDRRMDQDLTDALEALEAVLADESLWLEFTMERGQLQFLNNWETAHYRSNFKDAPEPRQQRHLVRLWYREAGRPFYDG